MQITAAEDLGIGARAGYYDNSGALRDMVQDHLIQLLWLLCMEPPVTFSADAVRNEGVKVLHAIKLPKWTDGRGGQYTGGMAEGNRCRAIWGRRAYPPDSTT